ncbi:MAG: PAS domain S-box-containing protein, partial [Halobacteriales archaeon]
MDTPIRLLSVDPTGGAGHIEALFDEDSVSVTTATDGEGAISVLDTLDVDCVISQFDLPDSDGLELYRRVRATAPGTGFVLYPADGNESIAGKAVAAGVDGYVPRTAAGETLRKRVVDVVNSVATEATRPTISSGNHSLLVEQSPLAIIEWDLDFRVIGWNPAAEDLFGYDRTTALGRSGTGLIVPESARSRIEAGWQELTDSGDATDSINENRRADGTIIECHWQNAPIVQDGEIMSVVSIVRDVSEEVRRADTLEALQEATPRLLRASSPAEVAESAVNMATTVLGHPLVTVRLHDKRSGEFRLSARSDEANEMLITTDSVADDEGLLGEVFESGTSRVIDDLVSSETVHGEAFPVESAIIEPLGEHGLLTVGADRQEAFETIDVNFTDILATTTEAALDRADIAAELRERNAKIENLHAVVARLDKCETEREIWDLTVDAAEGVLRFDECVVDEVVGDTMITRATSSDLLPEGYVDTAPADEGIAGKTHREGETFVIDDLRAAGEAVPEDENYRSLLSVPVGEVGVFQAVSREIGAFDENDTDLAELLIAHVADAIERV